MAVNPNDLLIFQGREGEETQKKKQKKPLFKFPEKNPEQPKAEQPVQQQPQPKPVQQQPKPQPQAQQPKPQPQVQQPKPQPQPAAKPVAQPKPVQKPAPVPAPQPVVAPVEEAKAEAAQPAPEAAEEIVHTQLEEKLGYEEGPKEELEGPAAVQRGAARKVSVKQMKEIASHMTCENHPWRKAYAICDYCKRPFCYEDIVEQNGLYYCLDDIDKVPTNYVAEQTYKYTSISFVSAGFFLLVFLVFIYFSYLQILQLPQLNIANFSQANAIFLGEIALAVLSFLTGVLVMVQSKASFKLGAFVGIATVALFSYQMINTLMLEYGIVAGVSFIGLVILAYSRVSYEVLPEETIEQANQGVLSMTQSGNF